MMTSLDQPHHNETTNLRAKRSWGRVSIPLGKAAEHNHMLNNFNCGGGIVITSAQT